MFRSLFPLWCVGSEAYPDDYGVSLCWNSCNKQIVVCGIVQITEIRSACQLIGQPGNSIGVANNENSSTGMRLDYLVKDYQILGF